MSRVLVPTEYGGAETQKIIERPIPAPGPGEITIKVKAAGVNPVDWKLRAGQLGSQGPLPAPMGLEKITGVAQYGLVDPHLTERFSPDEAHRAIAVVESGHSAGKVIIEP